MIKTLLCYVKQYKKIIHSNAYFYRVRSIDGSFNSFYHCFPY